MYGGRQLGVGSGDEGEGLAGAIEACRAGGGGSVRLTPLLTSLREGGRDELGRGVDLGQGWIGEVERARAMRRWCRVWGVTHVARQLTVALRACRALAALTRSGGGGVKPS